jgi:hypothetical protein
MLLRELRMPLRRVRTVAGCFAVGSCLVCAAVTLDELAPRALAQARGRGNAGPQAATPTPQSNAALDLTGNWVAVVTEDWRWRMVTPPKGDYASVPLGPEGIKAADRWTPSMDGQCEAFAMGGLLRRPLRLRVSWQDPQTLKIETDAGEQTRLLHFDQAAAAPTERTLQGFTRAEWLRPLRGGGGGGGGANAGFGPQPPTAVRAVDGPGSLRAVTTMLKAGWVRRNGVGYSEKAEIEELFDRYTAPNKDEWFSVTTIVRDPTYFTEEFVVSSHFKREPDGSKWSPSACRTVS